MRSWIISPVVAPGTSEYALTVMHVQDIMEQATRLGRPVAIWTSDPGEQVCFQGLERT